MNLCKGFNCMPDTTRPINDRTFFILYALTKSSGLEISTISTFYKNYSIKDILNEFELINECGVDIELNFSINLKIPVEIVEKIEGNKNDIEDCINNIDKIEQYSVTVHKLLPFAMWCRFCCTAPDKITKVIDDYLSASVNNRSLYFYNLETHVKIFKKVKQWATNNMVSPYKIGYDRFFEYITESNKTKYAFFHFLYEQEKTKVIKISELLFQDDNPLIIFEKWKEKTHKKKEPEPEGAEIVAFYIFHLYKNGVYNAASKKFYKCDNIEFLTFRLFLSQPCQEFTYEQIAAVLGLSSINDVPKRISKARKHLNKIVGNNNTEYFINNQSKKKYKFINIPQKIK